MTLHLAVTAPWMATQIGDRLTSMADAGGVLEYDTRANKSLLVYTGNCVV